jgi:D-glycero-beta-D-manno-heptose 1-phosphate adenylyltransferase
MQPETLSESKKILSRQALIDCVRRLKQDSKTIVSTNGSFDLLHLGHVSMLQEARSLGDVLIVGLNSDTGIRRYKGKYRPICPEMQRAGMLAALACVDYITVFDELTPIELLSVIQPHIHVNSPEHGKDCVEREVVEKYGGRIHLAQLIAGMSTTQLLGRIQESLAHTPAVAIFLNAESLALALAETETPEQRQEAIRLLFTQFTQQNFQIVIFHTASVTQPEGDVKELLGENIPPEGGELTVTFCRSEKSSVELFETLADEQDLILAKSVVISHDLQDIQAGRTLNCKTILLADSAVKSDQKTEARSVAHLATQTLQVLPELLQQL